MPHRRQYRDSFRDDVDRLVTRLEERDQRPPRKEAKHEGKKPRSRCEAFHNQILFEQAER